MGRTRYVFSLVLRGAIVALAGILGANYISTAAADPPCPAGKPCAPIAHACPADQAWNTQKNACVAIPSISSLSPAGGQGGTRVTIKGTGFAAGATVPFSLEALKLSMTNVTVVSPTEITAVVPNGLSLSSTAGETLDVQVTVAGETSKAVSFSYCPPGIEYIAAQQKCVAPPSIGSINPSGGPAGTQVTINGTGFAAGATVPFGNTQATNVTVISPTQIAAVVPAGQSISANLTGTPVGVQVTAAGQTSKVMLFTYCSTVTEYNPGQQKCVPPPSATGSAAPLGSYLQTCNNVSYNLSTGILSAACQPVPPNTTSAVAQFLGAGPAFNVPNNPTTLHAPSCNPGADIANIAGNLTCQALAGNWGEGGAVPNGSYQRSCLHWTVTPAAINGVQIPDVLQAQCAIMSSTPWQWTGVSLDLTQCSMSGDIENIEGHLYCAPK